MLGKNLIQAAAGNAGGEVLGVEDVFSTWLYTGNGSTQTITNGIDLSGEGGLVWTKNRVNTRVHELVDTARGVGKRLDTTGTGAEVSNSDVTGFSATGYTLGFNSGLANYPGETHASWTFRKAPGFFDVVTWTGDGTSGLISHNHSLGSTPGCIIIKGVSGSSPWQVYHRSLGTDQYVQLNSTSAAGSSPSGWAVTSSTFSIESSIFGFNTSGQTYVAYLFAHDAGGFGDSGNDSVVKCGITSGIGEVDLGWEPQFVLVKSVQAVINWDIFDSMRGFAVGSTAQSWTVSANTASAESGNSGIIGITSKGFQSFISNQLIYIAIRRGPMKTPTDATTVFSAITQTGGGASGATVQTGHIVDGLIGFDRTSWVYNSSFFDRLRGSARPSITSSTAAERTDGTLGLDRNTSFFDQWFNTNSIVYYSFRRAPGFFDVVAYTGTGTSQSVNHNLGVAPELLINKSRSSDVNFGWPVYAAPLGNNTVVRLNETAGVGNSSGWNNQTPTSSQFFVNGYNNNGVTYVAYLFASCPGVSKVGSYTGTGTTLDIDCGFTSGARFVLIKRTDSTGDWYVWDTARGIVAGNDPYLLLNSTAAEVTSTDYIDPLSSGFQISSTAPAAINANGGSFIYLAIA